MTLFIEVTFWVTLIAAIGRLFLIAVTTYPRQSKEEIGSDLAKFIEAAFFAIWAGILLFR